MPEQRKTDDALLDAYFRELTDQRGQPLPEGSAMLERMHAQALLDLLQERLGHFRPNQRVALEVVFYAEVAKAVGRVGYLSDEVKRLDP